MTLARSLSTGDVQNPAEEGSSGVQLPGEEALRRVNAKLRLLSAITRHDISNQLTALSGYLDLIQERYPSLAQDLEKVEAAAEQIGTLIRFSREYEDIGSAAPVWHDLHALVDSSAAWFGEGTIRVENRISPGIEILADPLVTRVLFNLLDNALRHGGNVTRVCFSAEESCEGLLLVCEDDGEGIPLEEKDRIFDRGVGRNTGMGLFLAREILSMTGIGIRETGEPGEGARFEIPVPAGAFRLTGRDGSRVLCAGAHSLVPVLPVSRRFDLAVKDGFRVECRDTPRQFRIAMPGK